MSEIRHSRYFGVELGGPPYTGGPPANLNQAWRSQADLCAGKPSSKLRCLGAADIRAEPGARQPQRVWNTGAGLYTGVGIPASRAFNCRDRNCE